MTIFSFEAEELQSESINGKLLSRIAMVNQWSLIPVTISLFWRNKAQHPFRMSLKSGIERIAKSNESLPNDFTVLNIHHARIA